MLRAEAEDEFRQMCLEFPQFSFDVSSKSHRLLQNFARIVELVLTCHSSSFG